MTSHKMQLYRPSSKEKVVHKRNKFYAEAFLPAALINITIFYLIQRTLVRNDIYGTYEIDLERTRRYCFVPNVFNRIGNEYPDQSQMVALVLHTSVLLLNDDFVKHIRRWEGPVSVSVVLHEVDRDLRCAYNYLRSAITKHKLRNIRFHFVFTKTRECSLARSELALSVAEGGEQEDAPPCPPRTLTFAERALYPVNLARNVARDFAEKSEFIVFPPTGLRPQSELPVYPEGLAGTASAALNRMKADVFLLPLLRFNGWFDQLRYFLRIATFDLPPVNLRQLRRRPALVATSRFFRYNTSPQHAMIVRTSVAPRYDPAIPDGYLEVDESMVWELCRAGARVIYLATAYASLPSETPEAQKELSSVMAQVTALNAPAHFNGMYNFLHGLDGRYPNTSRVDDCPAMSAPAKIKDVRS